MPYIAPRPDQDPNAPVSITSTPGGSVGASSVVGSAPRTSSGSGFTNISAFLNSQTNQQGGQRLGETLAADIGREVGEATTAVQAGQTAAQQAISTNTRPFNQGAIQQTINTGELNDDARQQLSGTYTGPNALRDVGARDVIDRETAQAQQRANLASTSGGRAEYLRQLAGRPVSAGVARLNNAFLNTNEAGVQNVQQQAQRAGTLSNEVSAAEAETQALANQARSTNEATRQAALGRITGFLDTRAGELDAQTAARRQELQAQLQAQRNYLETLRTFGAPRAQAGGSTGQVDTSTPEGRARALSSTTGEGAVAPLNDFVGPRSPGLTGPQVPPGFADNSQLVGGFQSLGLTDAQARRLQDLVLNNALASGNPVDLTNFMTQPNIEGFGRQNVLTAQEAARLNALAQIAGRQGNFQATAPVNQTAFDFNAAVQALEAAREAAVASRPVVGPPSPTGPVAPAPVSPVPAPAPAPRPADQEGRDRFIDIATGRTPIPAPAPAYVDPEARDRFIDIATGRTPIPAPAPAYVDPESKNIIDRLRNSAPVAAPAPSPSIIGSVIDRMQQQVQPTTDFVGPRVPAVAPVPAPAPAALPGRLAPVAAPAPAPAVVGRDGFLQQVTRPAAPAPVEPPITRAVEPITQAPAGPVAPPAVAEPVFRPIYNAWRDAFTDVDMNQV